MNLNYKYTNNNNIQTIKDFRNVKVIQGLKPLNNYIKNDDDIPGVNKKVIKTIKPNEEYNQYFNKLNNSTKSKDALIQKLVDVLNIDNISDQSVKSINTMIVNLKNINLNSSLASRKFRSVLNGLTKSDQTIVNFEIDLLHKIFLIIEENKYKVVKVKKSISIFIQKDHIINFLKKNISINKEIVILISRFQNSSKYVKFFYTLISKSLVNKVEVISLMLELLKDFKQIKRPNLFTFVGGKAKFINHIQKIMNNNIDIERVKKLVIPFGASGMDFMNVAPLLSKDTKIVLNSNNKINSQLFIDLRDNSKELINELIDLESQSVLNNYDASSNDYKEMLKDYLSELNTLENNNDFGLRSSALFMFLSNKSFGGNISFRNNKTYISFSNSHYKQQLSTIHKVEHFSFWLSKFKNVEIMNADYKEVLNKHNAKDTLTILDPLYVKEDEESLELKSTSVNYGNEGFPHLECLNETLKLSQFIYHNYNNKKLIELMTTNNNVSFNVVDRYAMNSKVKTNKKVRELIFYSNSHYKHANNTQFERDLLVS